MRIDKATVVTIDFSMYDAAENELLETSINDTPLVYLHGVGELPEGLEVALTGKQAGEQLNITLKPEDAYGFRDEQLVQAVDRDQFEDVELKVGMTFEAETDDGPRVVRIVAINGDEVTVDANERYAGRSVRFEISVLGVREATEEEVDHGHAHGEGCEHEMYDEEDDDFDDEDFDDDDFDDDEDLDDEDSEDEEPRGK